MKGDLTSEEWRAGQEACKGDELKARPGEDTAVKLRVLREAVGAYLSARDGMAGKDFDVAISWAVSRLAALRQAYEETK